LSSMMNFLPCAIDSTGHACCHLSPVSSIKNCCCETNIWRLRIAFSERTCPPASG
jgi:hypothetical protein